ncbi:hypothetical protein L5515_018864 [Caenorhabditis briggsae]|uniref:Uncharacterized protein n=1 Tax=Caenorhabditis briggsae TaxID=6238 RepID=A0AAE9FKB7_CAEBR|nr:hypothetical protein L5515_018864 [Caenorhabditis briggsae]
MVVNQLESPDLLNLSICSNRSTLRVCQASPKNCAESVSIYLKKPNPSIKITFFGFRKPLEWVFCFEEDFSQKYIHRNLVVSEYHYITAHHKNSPEQIMCRNADVVEGFLKILEFFLKIFPVRLKIGVQPNIGGLQILFKSNIFAQCSEMKLTRSLENHAFNRQELGAIFKKIKVLDKLEVIAHADYVIRQAFIVDHVTLAHATWMCEHDLFRLNCRSARFLNHTFQLDDIEDLALQWLAKPYTPRLERMEFEWDPLVEIQFFTLETTKWDKNKRSRCCYKIHQRGIFDCSETFDFTRSDGLMASIGVVERGYFSTLIFYVWHDRFPTRNQQNRLKKRLNELQVQQRDINRRLGDGNDFEQSLTNPNLSAATFGNYMIQAYNLRKPRGSSKKLEEWYKFHCEILDVKKQIERERAKSVEIKTLLIRLRREIVRNRHVVRQVSVLVRLDHIAVELQELLEWFWFIAAGLITKAPHSRDCG